MAVSISDATQSYLSILSLFWQNTPIIPSGSMARCIHWTATRFQAIPLSSARTLAAFERATLRVVDRPTPFNCSRTGVTFSARGHDGIRRRRPEPIISSYWWRRELNLFKFHGISPTALELHLHGPHRRIPVASSAKLWRRQSSPHWNDEQTIPWVIVLCSG